MLHRGLKKNRVSVNDSKRAQQLFVLFVAGGGASFIMIIRLLFADTVGNYSDLYLSTYQSISLSIIIINIR